MDTLFSRATALAMAALMASLALPIAMAVNSGGGTIGNSAPTVPTFASAGGAAQTRSTSDIFSGTVRDTNGEVRISQISVEFTTAPGGVGTTRFDRAIVPGDLLVVAEPGSFTSGWKVWNSGGANGILSFKFQYTWTVNGAYVVEAFVQDQAASDETGPAASISITITDGFSVNGDPVLADGSDDTGNAWGTWSATPGASNVDSANYLKVTNTGSNAAQAFTMDFTPSVFTGDDATTTFSLDTNIKFACAEGSASDNPEDLTFTLGSASASGSVSKTFTGLSNVFYCTYRLVAIPDPLLDQDYTAAFTVT